MSMNTPQRPNSALNTPGQGNTSNSAFKPSFTPVKRGKHAPPRLCIYGAGGLGKTTLAMNAPKPVFLDLEDGLDALEIPDHIDILEPSEPIESWEQLLATIQAIINDPGDRKSIVIDTLDRAEWLCWEFVCRKARVESIEKIGGGYGKGYTAAYEEFRRLVHLLETLRSRHGFWVIVNAHAKIENAGSAETDEYQRWTLKVDKRVAGLIVESFDAVLFARLEIFVAENKNKKMKGFGDVRVLETEGSAAWVAKNRYKLPKRMSLSWDELSAALARGAGEVGATLHAEINTALEKLSALDSDAATKAREACEGVTDTGRLSVLLNKINAGIAAREASRNSNDTNG